MKKNLKNIKIAYIGGGSRGWAWGLMADLAVADDICGEVALYDIDLEAAKNNEIIGNKLKNNKKCLSAWNYKMYETIDEALDNANFVIISILPGTFDEMESDVHLPEKYGIYQSVGDTTGPGGIVRSLRTIPMFEEIAMAVKRCCPKAWVINYTNPMTVCVRTLYRIFPEIKAFGCCHEVFGTQRFLLNILKENGVNMDDAVRTDIKVNVVGVNHFTWLTEAHYGSIDLFPMYADFCEKHYKTGYAKQSDTNWMNSSFHCAEMVKMHLFRKYGYIAAAGDRHLAEFCEGKWFLENPECVKKWKFGLTSVGWRKKDLQERLARSERYLNDEEEFKFIATGEDGVRQIRALLGLEDIVTNVNIPNYGQIPNLPLGAVVETNAAFRDDMVTPVFAGEIPMPIYPLVSRIVGEQEMTVQAGIEKNLDMAFEAFTNDPLVTINEEKAKELFCGMIENTKKYLKAY